MGVKSWIAKVSLSAATLIISLSLAGPGSPLFSLSKSPHFNLVLYHMDIGYFKETFCIFIENLELSDFFGGLVF